MRIGVNLLPFHEGVGGTWQYTGNLLRALADYPTDDEFVVAVTPRSLALVPPHPRFSTEMFAINPSARAGRIMVEHFSLPGRFQRRRVDCVHHMFGTLPYTARSPVVVTVYDLMVFDRPRDFSPIKRAYLRHMVRRTAHHAAIIAPISRSTGEHIQRVFHVPDDRICVVPPIVPNAFRPVGSDVVRSFRSAQGLPEQFWLCVTTGHRHKNLRRLLDAFAIVRTRIGDGWPLVIRGNLSADARTAVQSLPAQAKVTTIGPLPLSDMPALYGAASALVFPSLFEGGGQPLVEALACGCPVVASNIPTTREFAGNAAVPFDPESTGALADAMIRCETSPDLRASLRSAGMARAATLGSHASAALCLGAYARAVSRT
jgi:glycosyltransferase involved in cell wall biosynthesis